MAGIKDVQDEYNAYKSSKNKDGSLNSQREAMSKAATNIRIRRNVEEKANVMKPRDKKRRDEAAANTKLLNDAEADYETKYGTLPVYKKGGSCKAKGYAKGGGCELRGKTKGRMV